MVDGTPCTEDYVPTADGAAPCFFDYRTTYPELELLREHFDVLVDEMKAATQWNDWPEQNLYRVDKGHEWRVVPFCYTFPANDPSQTVWIENSCRQCPRTVDLLRSIPGVRTALYSRMAPGTKLVPHQGWAELSNHVLRAHLALDVPSPHASGVAVEGEVGFHSRGDIMMFDDSKMHLGFNNCKAHRCVLIVDVARPEHIPLGRATGGQTEALKAFIDYFSHGGDGDLVLPSTDTADDSSDDSGADE